MRTPSALIRARAQTRHATIPTIQEAHPTKIARGQLMIKVAIPRMTKEELESTCQGLKNAKIMTVAPERSTDPISVKNIL